MHLRFKIQLSYLVADAFSQHSKCSVPCALQVYNVNYVNVNVNHVRERTVPRYYTYRFG